MAARRFYVTTAIPYVNGDPHLGFALECVQADVLARHRRARGDDVRLLSGTDDNSLKNVVAAEAAGVAVADFVRAKGDRFAALPETLELSLDDFIRTSVDPRHRPGVERLWRACAAAGDLYERDYEGLYCGGCEAFLTRGELVEGLCPEHREPPERVAERNWFFRLTRQAGPLLHAIESGCLRVEPEQRRNEVLAFVRGGLEDFSVSRSRVRARGWGIAVPGDPGQVVYVWFDALANYVTALGYASGGGAYRSWWRGGGRRVHVVGKGILRFHAVYWPAILLSAGEPLPTEVFVHDYLTVNGAKLSKSGGAGLDPSALVARYGVDALRWWFARDVPRSGDADVRPELVALRGNELADGLGNLVNRTLALVERARPQGVARVEPPPEAFELLGRVSGLGPAVDVALERFDLRSASAALWDVVVEANRFVTRTKPWELAHAERDGDASAGPRLDAVLGVLTRTCEALAAELRPFLPGAAARIEEALETRDPTLGRALFAKTASSG